MSSKSSSTFSGFTSRSVHHMPLDCHSLCLQLYWQLVPQMCISSCSHWGVRLSSPRTRQIEVGGMGPLTLWGRKAPGWCIWYFACCWTITTLNYFHSVWLTGFVNGKMRTARCERFSNFTKVFFDLTQGCLPPKQRSSFCRQDLESCTFSNATIMRSKRGMPLAGLRKTQSSFLVVHWEMPLAPFAKKWYPFASCLSQNRANTCWTTQNAYKECAYTKLIWNMA